MNLFLPTVNLFFSNKMVHHNIMYVFPVLTPSGIFPVKLPDTIASQIRKLNQDLSFTLNILDQMVKCNVFNNLFQGVITLTLLVAANTLASKNDNHSPSNGDLKVSSVSNNPVKEPYGESNFNVNDSVTNDESICVLLTKLTTEINCLHKKVSSEEDKSRELVSHINTLSGVVFDLKSKFGSHPMFQFSKFQMTETH